MEVVGHLQPPKPVYIDKKYEGGPDAYLKAISLSATVYVGNLSHYTSEAQIWEVFSKCGDVKKVIMGIDREKKTPCGFCFVEFFRRRDARDSIRFINGTKIDERPVRVDWDPGFQPGRQFGRGMLGGQVRDELRQGYDPGRGGVGGRAEAQKRMQQRGGGRGGRRGGHRNSRGSSHRDRRHTPY